MCATLGHGNAASTFAEKAIARHGDRYSYDKVQYTGQLVMVTVVCRLHGDFDVRPKAHLLGKGCRTCFPANKKYSNKSCDWLDFVASQDGITIQHARNAEEFRVPSTPYKVDGYCVETGVLYEFLGDFWHGNPAKFAPDEYHRLDVIRALGYTVVCMWERDWDARRH